MQTMRFGKVGCMALAGVCFVSHGGEAKIEINGYNPSEHWRFANDPAFIASGYDLSGVARSSSNKWATLISPNTFLSARHWHPGEGQTITFFEGNDPTGAQAVRTVLGGIQVADTDIWFGVLDAPLPPSYRPLPVVDLVVADTNAFLASELFNLEVFLVGRSDNASSSVTNIALGKNRIESWDESYFDGLTVTNNAAIAIRHEPADVAFVTHEAYLQIYDSGAPLLAVLDGRLTIIGFNWAIEDTDDMDYHPVPNPGLRQTSLFSYAGDHASLIHAYIEAFAAPTTSGYLTWMQNTFPEPVDWALSGPASDADGDGVLNLMEYLAGLGPLDPASRVVLRSEVIYPEGSPRLRARFSLREDAALDYSLLYTQEPQADSTHTEVSVSFNGSGWASSLPSVVSISSTEETSGGIWRLEVLTESGLNVETPQFLLLKADTAGAD